MTGKSRSWQSSSPDFWGGSSASDFVEKGVHFSALGLVPLRTACAELLHHWTCRDTLSTQLARELQPVLKWFGPSGYQFPGFMLRRITGSFWQGFKLPTASSPSRLHPGVNIATAAWLDTRKGTRQTNILKNLPMDPASQARTQAKVRALVSVWSPAPQPTFKHPLPLSPL